MAVISQVRLLAYASFLACTLTTFVLRVHIHVYYCLLNPCFVFTTAGCGCVLVDYPSPLIHSRATNRSTLPNAHAHWTFHYFEAVGLQKHRLHSRVCSFFSTVASSRLPVLLDMLVVLRDRLIIKQRHKNSSKITSRSNRNQRDVASGRGRDCDSHGGQSRHGFLVRDG